MANYNMETIFFPLRNKYRFRIILIGLFAVLVGSFFYIQRTSFGIYWILYAVLSALPGLYLIFTNVRIMINGGAGIYLTGKDLILKTATRNVLFDWKDIRSFRLIQKSHLTLIGIELFDHDKFISTQKGLLRSASQDAIKSYGVSYVIFVNAYNVSAETLWKQLNENLEKDRFHS